MARKKSGGRKKTVSRQKNGRNKPPSKRNGSRAGFKSGSPARVVGSLQRNAPEPWVVKYDGKQRVSYDDYGFSARDVDVLKIHDKSGNIFQVLFVDHSNYIEVYGIFAETMGTGFGTKVLEAIKQYADENDKGMLITYVAHEKFMQRFPWLRRRDAIIDEDLTFTEVGGWPEYVYGDVPTDAMDYSYILKVMKVEG